MLDNIVDYYSEYDENNRLISRYSLERIRSQEIILRYITKKPSRIADVGGGPGHYSFWLAEQGHRVTLLDLVPKHIEQANLYSQESGISLESLLLGNACKLPFDEHAFDIVLLMGPLYHLPEKKSRIRALTEARRVLKSKGTLIAAAISRFASLIDGLKYDLVNDPDFVNIVHQDLATGHHQNRVGNPKYFTSSYFHHPHELKDELSESGFECEGLFGVECFGGMIPDIEEKLKDEAYKSVVLDLTRRIESEGSIISASLHMIAIGVLK